MTEISNKNLLNKVQETLLKARECLKKTSKSKLTLIIAVSGGEDSVSLLDILNKLKEENDLNLIVAHFDHGLREQSTDDGLFVKKLAEKYNLKFFIARADTKPVKKNIEAWAREERYGFLEQIRLQENADLIVTAHHQQDRVETFLMRLLSLRMIASAKTIQEIDLNRKVFRPFLQISKQEIRQYFLENKLVNVIDQSNFDLARTRNLIRHDLLPKLEKEFNPDLLSGIVALENRLTEDEDFIYSIVNKIFQEIKDKRNLEDILKQEAAVQWRLLAFFAEQDLGANREYISYLDLMQSLDLLRQFKISNGESKKISLKNFVEFFVEGANYFAFRNTNEHIVFQEEQLLIPGEVKSNLGFSLSSQILHEKIDWLENIVTAKKTDKYAVEYFDYDCLRTISNKNTQIIFNIRPRKDGDEIKVWKRGSRKLKKLLLEKGLRLTLRSCIPIVEYEEKIIWVPGVARSEIAPITDKTINILELKYVRSV